METRTVEAAARKTKQTLQLKRPLVPIEEYVAREGISPSVVQEYRQLGIVQIRKHKGRTFVIDVPIDPYPAGPGAVEEASQAAGRPIEPKKVSKSLEKLVPAAHAAAEERSKPPHEPVKAGRARLEQGRGLLESLRTEPLPSLQITEKAAVWANLTAKAEKVVQVIKAKLRRTSQTTNRLIESLASRLRQAESTTKPLQVKSSQGPTVRDESAKSGSLIVRLKKASQLFKLMFRPLKTNNKLARDIDNETMAAERLLESSLSPQKSRLRPDISAPQVGFGYFRQVAAALLLVLLFAGSLLVNLLLFANKTVQRDQLGDAYASMQLIHNNYLQASQQVKALRNRLSSSAAELKRIRTELNSSKARVNSINNKLIRSGQNLKIMQQRNAEAVGPINKRFPNLTAPASKIAEQHQIQLDLGKL